MDVQDNPFASPREQVHSGPDTSTEQELIRRQYLKHEAAIRSMGFLYAAGGTVGCVMSLFYFSIGMGGIVGAIPEIGTLAAAGTLMFAICFGLYSFFQARVGFRLRKLDPAARRPAIILSAISLPFWTLLAGYFLYLVACSKGKYVLSADYAEIRRATPHIKYKTPISVWILIGLLIAVLVSGGILAIFE